jgi:hypothetical protein
MIARKYAYVYHQHPPAKSTPPIMPFHNLASGPFRFTSRIYSFSVKVVTPNENSFSQLQILKIDGLESYLILRQQR